MDEIERLFRCQENCDHIIQWAVEHCTTAEQVWRTAPDEYIVWIATHCKVLDRDCLTQFALWCARSVYECLPVQVQRAVEMAEDFDTPRWHEWQPLAELRASLCRDVAAVYRHERPTLDMRMVSMLRIGIGVLLCTCELNDHDRWSLVSARMVSINSRYINGDNIAQQAEWLRCNVQADEYIGA